MHGDMLNEKILVVDDDDGIRGLIKGVLSDEYKIIGEAKSGEKAIAIFKDTDPDLVLLDIRMPEKDGFEVFNMMRKVDPDQKIIFYSVVNPVEKVQKRYKDLADGYIVKPARKQKLLETVKDVLEQ